MTKIVISGIFELILILLLIYGFTYENKIIQFEQVVAWFYRECKQGGYSKIFFLKGLIYASIMEIKERVGR